MSELPIGRADAIVLDELNRFAVDVATYNSGSAIGSGDQFTSLIAARARGGKLKTKTYRCGVADDDLQRVALAGQPCRRQAENSNASLTGIQVVGPVTSSTKHPGDSISIRWRAR